MFFFNLLLQQLIYYRTDLTCQLHGPCTPDDLKNIPKIDEESLAQQTLLCSVSRKCRNAMVSLGKCEDSQCV